MLTLVAFVAPVAAWPHPPRATFSFLRRAPAPALADGSKFVALMAGEDLVADPIKSLPVAWSAHAEPAGFGSAELRADIVDPAAAPGTVPREMHLAKQLLRESEVDAICARFDALGNAAAVTSHAQPVVEDGRVVCPELHALLEPALDQRILPWVRARLGERRVVVADALLRAYRQDDARQALAPHLDVSAYATVIVPLNPGEYTGGVYVQRGADADSRVGVDASFAKGDCLLHRFDVMHGVEVRAGDRYSLVLWLSDCAESVAAKATPWLKTEAERGNAYAQFLYSEACSAGSGGVPRDARRAADFAARAARQGHALSQFALGFRCKAGSGVEQSDARCAELWAAAAAAGLASAQYNLGACHANGRLGLPKSDVVARHWYERAARQGHADAADVLRIAARTGGDVF